MTSSREGSASGARSKEKSSTKRPRTAMATQRTPKPCSKACTPSSNESHLSSVTENVNEQRQILAQQEFASGHRQRDGIRGRQLGVSGTARCSERAAVPEQLGRTSQPARARARPQALLRGVQ